MDFVYYFISHKLQNFTELVRATNKFSALMHCGLNSTVQMRPSSMEIYTISGCRAL